MDQGLVIMDIQIRYVVPYTVLEDTNTVMYCQSQNDRRAFTTPTSDVNSFMAATRELLGFYRGSPLSDEDWKPEILGRSNANLCLFRYICIFSIIHRDGYLFVPFPNKVGVAKNCEVSVPKSELIALLKAAKESPLYQGVVDSDFSLLASTVVTPRPTEYAVLILNHTDLGAGIFDSWYVGLYRAPGEIWNSYWPPKGLFPDDSTLAGLKGIILTGGPASANSTMPWMKETMRWLKHVHEDYPHIKIVGICLGSQMMAKALGGFIQKSPAGMVLGTELVHTVEEKRQKYGLKASYYIPENHNEEVSGLPDGAEVLAYSETCEIEIWGKDGNILALQSHPNYTNRVMELWALPSMRRARMISRELFNKALRQMIQSPNDSEEVNNLISQFLRS